MFEQHEVDREAAREAKQGAAEAVAPFGLVTGVGLARRGDGYAVRVHLREAPPPGAVLPRAVDGVSVEVRVVGTIQAG
jgi:hypothetical protein